LGILVVGSVGLDDIQAPAGSRTRILGGACTYFATAASLYDRVHMVAVIGNDFPHEHLEFLGSRNIDTAGLQVMEGKTFHWSGRYGPDLDDAETLDTQLNVFADFHPAIPEAWRDLPYVFLANIDPELQLEVLEQMRAPRLTALDSMNYWMGAKRQALTRAISLVDIVLLNESEVKLFAQEGNLVAAARRLLQLGPKALVIKRGEHGAMLMTHNGDLRGDCFAVPAYPLDRVVDPTGAGDTFAAGFMGYLARCGELSIGSLRRALVHGTVVASFTVQDFGIDRLRTLTATEIEARYTDLQHLTYLAPPADVTALERPFK